jgi:hypothetical protein
MGPAGLHHRTHTRPFMIASRFARLPAIAATAFSLSACEYDCGIQGGTQTSGTVRDAAGVTLGIAQASVGDYLRPSFLRLSASVNAPSGSAGAPLKGHVTGARLVSETGELISAIPTGTETLFSDGVVALNIDLPSRGEYDRVRSALSTGRARIILDTDLPGREHIETILGTVIQTPANIQKCRWN